MAAATEDTAVDSGARPGARAHVKFVRMSASKVRLVLNLIRGKSIGEALEILDFSERLAAQEVRKALVSAVANAGHNEDIPAEELYVSACFADQGPSLRRFRPRARGRAGRIEKQTCHITVEVSRYTDDEISDRSSRMELKEKNRSTRRNKTKAGGGDRSKRVAKSKAADDVAEEAVEESAEEVAADATEETAAVAAAAADPVDASDAPEAAAADGEEE